MSTLELDEINLEAVPEGAIAGYRIFRSPTNHTQFNVVAFDKNLKLLFVQSSDLTLDEASELMEVLNQPFNQQEEILQ